MHKVKCCIYYVCGAVDPTQSDPTQSASLLTAHTVHVIVFFICKAQIYNTCPEEVREGGPREGERERFTDMTWHGVDVLWLQAAPLASQTLEFHVGRWRSHAQPCLGCVPQGHHPNTLSQA